MAKRQVLKIGGQECKKNTWKMTNSALSVAYGNKIESRGQTVFELVNDKTSLMLKVEKVGERKR